MLEQEKCWESPNPRPTNAALIIYMYPPSILPPLFSFPATLKMNYLSSPSEADAAILEAAKREGIPTQPYTAKAFKDAVSHALLRSRDIQTTDQPWLAFTDFGEEDIGPLDNYIEHKRLKVRLHIHQRTLLVKMVTGTVVYLMVE
jgi:hypothetical protein